MKKNWEKALELETKFAQVVAEQVDYGWLVDRDNMVYLIDCLADEMAENEQKLEKELPYVPMNKGELRAWTPPKKQFLTNGMPSAICEKFFDSVKRVAEGYYVGMKGEYHVRLPYHEPIICQKPLTLGNMPEIKNYLMEHGWKPTWWNTDADDKPTSPKMKLNGIVCPNLEKVEHPIAKGIVHYMSMRHRKALLEGLLKVIRSDGTIPSEMKTIGTATHRVSHRKIANFPNTESYFGEEIRECFTCKKGRVLVSTDSDSCQLRMLAHYLIEVGETIDHPYIQAILFGTKEDDSDAHCLARDLAGLSTRSQGKTLNYALLFGQGDKAMAEQLNKSTKQVKAIKSKFFENVPALPRLISMLEQSYARRKGFVGLDGRMIWVDSEHKSLNYLLQSAEAIYMKNVSVIVYEKVKKYELDAIQVCFYHDEITHDCAFNDARELAMIHEQSMLRSGKELGINVPMTGSASIGKNWAEIH